MKKKKKIHQKTNILNNCACTCKLIAIQDMFKIMFQNNFDILEIFKTIKSIT